jgi:hypothetical protein
MLRSRRSQRGAFRTVTVTIFACLALGLLAASASAATYTPESMATLESQLHAGRVHAVVVRVKTHKVHASVNGLGKVTVAYVPSQEEAIIAAARARGVPVQVVKPKPEGFRSHHKLRYIAGGALILVIIIVVVVLLFQRRRKREAEMGMA